jgi:diadenosine tetraphosphate (Ap4A) HIT family hydrolase
MALCLACDVNEGRLVPPGGTIFEDDRWRADHELGRLVRGYVILKPLRHVHELADLTGDESATLGPTLRRLHEAMRTALRTERVYVCSFAETVHHLHFHMIPRYAGMPPLGPDLMPEIFAGRWSCDEAAAVQAADDVRTALSSS